MLRGPAGSRPRDQGRPMSISRRVALKTLAAAGATSLVPRPLRAAKPRRTPDPDSRAVLYDATLCVGCRECVQGCAEANGWDPELAFSDEPALNRNVLSVIRRCQEGGNEHFLKVQCMHCVDPACASACMLGAMHKDADGAVVWDGDLCVGCRYCQIACPFNVPRFEWDTPLPALNKCQLCPDRRAHGLPPACVEQCRRGALLYGSRAEMLDEARRRQAAHPGRYQTRIYGEHDGGGTSFLYLVSNEVSFARLGLPELGTESVPTLPETIQHTLYKGFVAPIALYGVLGAAVRRNSRRLHDEEAAHHPTERSEPVGGPLLTWRTAILAALALVAGAMIVWRFVAGLGATTNLNDGYPMGLWIAFDVVTGTALACGGYAMALLVYVANRGKYHPLVRAAMVTSALGYSLGGFSVLIDIGRAWNFYKIPLYFWSWNFNSILLEVALCIMLYTTVLWIEVSPAILERWRDSRVEGLRRVALRVQPRLERAMPYVIALGLLLPTMHQSSLGSLMLMAGQKLHPLWRTPLLPLLFLVSCVAMGYAAVTLESCISARVFKRPRETPMLRALGLPVSLVLLLYVAIRSVDVVWRGQVGQLLTLDPFSLLFLAEMALFLVPAVLLLIGRHRADTHHLLGAAVMVIIAGALYRFSTYLFAFDPGAQWTYFPSIPEWAVTVGLVAAEILGYVLLVKLFPILRGTTSPEAVPPPPPAPEREPALSRSASAHAAPAPEPAYSLEVTHASAH
ncbi:MAG: Ni/Fe-hydrogenase cytochrome b subunit [Longimicrobiales bacterium]|nr:Ni/Fe-hydrogenase cytochrome b subunit [Longimicrobiales bacterium]